MLSNIQDEPRLTFVPVAAAGEVLPLPDAPPEAALVPKHVPEPDITICACMLIAYWLGDPY